MMLCYMDLKADVATYKSFGCISVEFALLYYCMMLSYLEMIDSDKDLGIALQNQEKNTKKM